MLLPYMTWHFTCKCGQPEQVRARTYNEARAIMLEKRWHVSVFGTYTCPKCVWSMNWSAEANK